MFRRYAPNDTLLGLGYNTTIPSGENWVMQGRPRAGSTLAVPLRQLYPSTGKHSGGGNFTLRYIAFDRMVRTGSQLLITAAPLFFGCTHTVIAATIS